MKWSMIFVLVFLQLDQIDSGSLTRLKDKKMFSRIPPMFRSWLMDEDDCFKQQETLRKIIDKLDNLETKISTMFVVVETLQNKIQLVDDITANPPHSNVIFPEDFGLADNIFSDNLNKQFPISGDTTHELKTNAIEKPLDKVTLNRFQSDDHMTSFLDGDSPNRTPKHALRMGAADKHPMEIPEFRGIAPPKGITVIIENGSEEIGREVVTMAPHITVQEVIFQLEIMADDSDGSTPHCKMVYNDTEHCVQIKACVNRKSNYRGWWVTSIYNTNNEKVYSGICFPRQEDPALLPGYTIKLSYVKQTVTDTSSAI